MEYLPAAGFSTRTVNGPLDAGAYEFVGAVRPVHRHLDPARRHGRPALFVSADRARTGPITWLAAGFPAWAVLDACGLLHGTPSAPGSVLRVMARNTSTMDGHDLLLTVRPVPTAPLHRPSRAKK